MTGWSTMLIRTYFGERKYRLESVKGVLVESALSDWVSVPDRLWVIPPGSFGIFELAEEGDLERALLEIKEHFPGGDIVFRRPQDGDSQPRVGDDHTEFKGEKCYKVSETYLAGVPEKYVAIVRKHFPEAV